MNDNLAKRDEKRLITISNDLDSLEKEKFFFRHFLIHQTDLSSLLILCIRNLRPNPEKNSNQTQQEQLGQGDMTTKNKQNSCEENERTTSPIDFHSQIQQILKNSDKKSNEEQIELIQQLVLRMQREKELQKTRKIYTPANQNFISGK